MVVYLVVSDLLRRNFWFLNSFFDDVTNEPERFLPEKTARLYFLVTSRSLSHGLLVELKRRL